MKEIRLALAITFLSIALVACATDNSSQDEPIKEPILHKIDLSLCKKYGGRGLYIYKFSPNLRHLAWIARNRFSHDKECMISDGKEGKEYDEVYSSLTFSPNSKHLAYIAREGKKIFVVLDGSPRSKVSELFKTPATRSTSISSDSGTVVRHVYESELGGKVEFEFRNNLVSKIKWSFELD